MCHGLILVAFFVVEKSNFQIANLNFFQFLPKMQIFPKALRATFFEVDGCAFGEEEERFIAKTTTHTSSPSIHH